MSRIVKRYWIPLLIGLLVVVDQWTKLLATEHLANFRNIVIIDGLFDLSLAHNTGAAFGLGRDWSPTLRAVIFLGFSCIAVGAMMWLLWTHRHGRWMESVPLTLIIGGAIGNLIDRFRLGYVVDFIHVFYEDYHWPNFNVADSAICVGMTLFAIQLFRGHNNG